MSKLIQPKQSRSLEERYEMLRKTLAHYLLLQVGTFVAAAGFDAIGPAMDILTNMKAELKVQDIKAKVTEVRLRPCRRTWLRVWAKPSTATTTSKRVKDSGP